MDPGQILRQAEDSMAPLDLEGAQTRAGYAHPQGAILRDTQAFSQLPGAETAYDVAPNLDDLDPSAPRFDPAGWQCAISPT